MARSPTDATAAQNARWLAELSDALDAAQDLIWRLDSTGKPDAGALDLCARVEAARAQVRSLQFGRIEMAANSAPDWTSSLPWPAARSAPDPLVSG